MTSNLATIQARPLEHLRSRAAAGGPTARDPRWLAIMSRDRAADARFVYGVRTTGIYCRPSCASRRPRRENVTFFAAASLAEASGFRPCLRCAPAAIDPREARQRAVREACRTLEAAEIPPTLAGLAKAAQLGPARFQRLFKEVVGLSPKQYAIAVREQRMERALLRGVPVTDAVYQAGYGSASRFYENATERLGMKAQRYARGGAGLRVRFAFGSWSLGAFVIGVTDRGLCALELGEDPRRLEERLRQRFPRAVLERDTASLRTTVAKVARALGDPARPLELPFDLHGTAFQRRVWRALQTIPPGTTLSYADLARQVGTSAARPVASAVAANPVAVLIPCHRVLRTDGSLGGYRWGLPRKRHLLRRERPRRS
jgi:AraC family transcriptional regulator of adaptative response/methylated-DNA-[protein]-cysteine methyltransferase